MAKLKGILPIEGTVGNITFSKTQDGIIVREKGGIPAERIANDPAFVRTRENNQEFGRAGKAVKLVRNAFRSVVLGGADRRMIARMMKVMMEAIRMDQTNPRGLRNVIDGETVLLEGFDFNFNGKLTTTFYAPHTSAVDRQSGVLSISIPAYLPSDMVAAPQGATHYRVTAAGAIVDFENHVQEASSASSAILVLDNQATAAVTLACNVTANSAKPIFMALGIEFYQEVNGQKYPLKNGAYNALAIVKVDA